MTVDHSVISRLRPLKRRLLAVCFGAGVDSTAMLVALRLAGIRPHVITFADVGAEKPETMAHVELMNALLALWGWLPISICRKLPLPSTGYDDLYGNCIANETLPSLAFGMKSCSLGPPVQTVSFPRNEGRADRRANPKSWRWSARLSRRAATLEAPHKNAALVI
ncbi:hypothetical protein SAMN06295912_11277 [Sphingomonas laterariae]|uniref:Uncharacterized protein n=1 Tax=Edaphosphingomonas laterariae TaxID=861865 RepID=A0A239GI98_9SPHN|nr:hypothetical protein SAMN06295912_11277 [Sphingomonas laterariae]